MNSQRIFVPKVLSDRIAQKFPDVENIDEIVNAVFQDIVDVCIEYGTYLVNNFGIFSLYSAYSTKKGKILPRFKLKTSQYLIKNLANDIQCYTIVKKRFINAKPFDTSKESEQLKRIHDLNMNSKQAEINFFKYKPLIDERIKTDEISMIFEEHRKT